MLKVELRGIPSDWSIIPLIDLCTGKPEYGANVSSIEYREEFPRYVRITDISEEGFLLENNRKSIRPDNAESYLLCDGDMVFARSGATVGKTYLYRKLDGICAFAGYLIRFRPDPSRLHPGFLFQFTHSPIYYSWVQRVARHTAQPNINAKEYSKLSIPVPPVREQERIVELLDTIDTLILTSKESMACFQKIKKGLMQRLLTRGIGHTEFKKTKIGRIPESWNLLYLSQVADIIMGQSPPSSTYNDSGVGLPFYQGNTDFGFRVPFVRMYCSQPSRAAKGGDILMSVRAPVGEVNITEKRCAIGRGIAAIRTVSLVNEFLFQYLRSSGKYWTRVEQGSTFKAINKRDLENLLVPVPPEDEQQRIADVLFSVDAKILLEKKHRKTLEHLKKGLMQVLLTGNVRVRA